MVNCNNNVTSEIQIYNSFGVFHTFLQNDIKYVEYPKSWKVISAKQDRKDFKLTSVFVAGSAFPQQWKADPVFQFGQNLFRRFFLRPLYFHTFHSE